MFSPRLYLILLTFSFPFFFLSLQGEQKRTNDLRSQLDSLTFKAEKDLTSCRDERDRTKNELALRSAQLKQQFDENASEVSSREQATREMYEQQARSARESFETDIDHLRAQLALERDTSAAQLATLEAEVASLKEQLEKKSSSSAPAKQSSGDSSTGTSSKNSTTTANTSNASNTTTTTGKAAAVPTKLPIEAAAGDKATTAKQSTSATGGDKSVTEGEAAKKEENRGEEKDPLVNGHVDE